MPNKQGTDLTFHTVAQESAEYDYENITPKYSIEEDELNQESLCGLDQRVKVTGTSTLPYKAICKLYMKSSSGKNYIGSGWLTHANKLYTAGHCVYDHDEGGWMASIIVVPALAGNSEPFGRYVAESYAAVNAWVDDRSTRFDMGAIRLSKNVSHSDFLVPTLSNVNSAEVCGYPADRDLGLFPYTMRDSVQESNGRFEYTIDTIGGQSGAPLLENRRKAIGIHNYGGCPNKASDLYQEFVDAVNNW